MNLSPEQIAALCRAGHAAIQAQMTSRDERIAKLTRTGHTARQIAETVGCTERTVQRARVRTGVAQPICVQLTDDEIRRAAEMLDDGASYSEVARTLKRADMTIRKHFPGLSAWAKGSGPQYRKLMAELEAIDKVGGGILHRQHKAALDALDPLARSWEFRKENAS